MKPCDIAFLAQQIRQVNGCLPRHIRNGDFMGISWGFNYQPYKRYKRDSVKTASNSDQKLMDRLASRRPVATVFHQNVTGRHLGCQTDDIYFMGLWWIIGIQYDLPGISWDFIAIIAQFPRIALSCIAAVWKIAADGTVVERIPLHFFLWGLSRGNKEIRSVHLTNIALSC